MNKREYYTKNMMAFSRFIGAKTSMVGNEVELDECPYCKAPSFVADVTSGKWQCANPLCGGKFGDVYKLSSDFNFHLIGQIDPEYTDFRTGKLVRCRECGDKGFILWTAPNGADYMRACKCEEGHRRFPGYFSRDKVDPDPEWTEEHINKPVQTEEEKLANLVTVRGIYQLTWGLAMKPEHFAKNTPPEMYDAAIKACIKVRGIKRLEYAQN